MNVPKIISAVLAENQPPVDFVRDDSGPTQGVWSYRSASGAVLTLSEEQIGQILGGSGTMSVGFGLNENGRWP